ncbi:hypothetical protein HN011_002956 [Eciton burchellii]|nr:hypothetical protein HN011_002956 [Eciton burchellii]
MLGLRSETRSPKANDVCLEFYDDHVLRCPATTTSRIWNPRMRKHGTGYSHLRFFNTCTREVTGIRDVIYEAESNEGPPQPEGESQPNVNVNDLEADATSYGYGPWRSSGWSGYYGRGYGGWGGWRGGYGWGGRGYYGGRGWGWGGYFG